MGIMDWVSNLFGGGGAKQAQDYANVLQQRNYDLQQRAYTDQAAEAERQRQELAADEAKRQESIRGGTSAIDNAFSQFNDQFFQGAQDKYSGYYLPQIDEQAGKTKDSLIAKLFDRGMLESTVGSNALADLETKRLNERARVGNEAADFSSGLRTKVNTQKNSLYDVARSAADPSAVASRATGEAATLAASPGGYQYANSNANLGDVFGSVLEPFAYGLNAYQNRLPAGYKPPGGGGSSLKIFG